MATARKFSAEEQRKLLAELEVPFDPAMVKWKVVRRARSGRRGAVLPFADPRAYTDRLNQVLTTAGSLLKWRSTARTAKTSRTLPAGVVGYAAVSRSLASLPLSTGHPVDPTPAPAPAGCIVPILHLEAGRAA
jgi:hypothetical protein